MPSFVYGHYNRNKALDAETDRERDGTHRGDVKELETCSCCKAQEQLYSKEERSKKAVLLLGAYERDPVA